MHPGIVEEKSALTEGKVAQQFANSELNKPEEIQIESRFGLVTIIPEKAINFPHGMPGIPGSISFCLTDLPNVKNEQFKLLQCLNDKGLSFIVVPSAYDNQLINNSDLDDACAVLGIDKNNLLLLFIVTSHESKEGRKLSINAKAPIFIDAISRSAVQYIFQNNNYEIQHYIS